MISNEELTEIINDTRNHAEWAVKQRELAQMVVDLKAENAQMKKAVEEYDITIYSPYFAT